MKSTCSVFVVAVAALTLFASVGHSQTAGTLRLSADASGVECNIADTGSGVVQVHMVVNDVTGLSAIQFAAPKPDCWSSAVWLGDVIPFLVVIGDTQFIYPNGLSIAGIGCLDGPVYLGYMEFFSTAPSPPCCEYPIVKVPTDLFPEIDGPIMVLCSSPEDVIGVFVEAVINGNPGCSCQQTVPVESRTWGRVKALYN